MRRVALHTLGCKLNFAETSTIGRQFVERGFQVVAIDDPSDVVVLNTCSVTERADREARQWIRRALRHSPGAFVVVVGCYAQLEPEEIASIDGVDLVLGATEKSRLFEYARDFHKDRYPRIHVSDVSASLDFAPAFSAEVGNRTRAFLKIQDGCDYTCAFCTIPLARGASRSMSPDAVVQQARMLADSGYREIVLTGVNVGDYGRKDGTSFLELLLKLDGIDGIDRIRVSSIEPNLLTERVIDRILGSRKFCNHFHIPLQSGSDAVLKRMRRRYLADDYRRVVEYINRQDSDAGIGADVIVGFPGETDELFEESLEFVIDLPVTYLHVFTYSERPNTPAAAFGGAVEPRVRFKRSEVLRMAGSRKRKEFFSRFLGASLPVLFEGGTEGNVSGLTTNYIRVRVDGGRELSNQILSVRLVDAKGDECRGELQDHTPSCDATSVELEELS